MAEYKVREENEIIFITITGELVLSTVVPMKDEIKNHLQGADLRAIVDLSGVDFVDSSGLGMLISWFKCVSEAKGRIVFAAITPYVKKIIKISKLDKIFLLADDVEQAKELL